MVNPEYITVPAGSLTPALRNEADELPCPSHEFYRITCDMDCPVIFN
jgi:hypothetical protein